MKKKTQKMIVKCNHCNKKLYEIEGYKNPFEAEKGGIAVIIECEKCSIKTRYVIVNGKDENEYLSYF